MSYRARWAKIVHKPKPRAITFRKPRVAKNKKSYIVINAFIIHASIHNHVIAKNNIHRVCCARFWQKFWFASKFLHKAPPFFLNFSGEYAIYLYLLFPYVI